MNATADWYTRFAAEARGQSAIYTAWAEMVAADDAVLALINELPRPKRQPNLIFAVSRLLGAPEGSPEDWREWLLAHWGDVRRESMSRSTQTNDPGRCAALVPALAGITGPIALLEVGASAGLCLYLDRYSYLYKGGAAQGGAAQPRLDPADGPSAVLLECEANAETPVPHALPTVVWRAGIDLAPLHTDNDADMLWLETLAWPEQHDRRERIRAATDVVRADPPQLVAGDAVDRLAALAATAPAGATLVIVAMGVIVYLSAEDRQRLVDAVWQLGAHWVTLEAPGVVPGIVPPRLASTGAGSVADAPADAPPERGLFALTLDGTRVAWASPHGNRLLWASATA